MARETYVKSKKKKKDKKTFYKVNESSQAEFEIERGSKRHKMSNLWEKETSVNYRNNYC